MNYMNTLSEKAFSFLNSNKAITVFLLALAVGIGGSQVAIQSSTAHSVDAQTEGWITQHVTVSLYRDIDNDGQREHYKTLANKKTNMLVDQGREFYAAKVAGTGFPSGADLFSNATYIALSNESSPQLGDVALQGEFTTGGLDRASCRNNGGDSTSGTYVDLGVGNYSCAVTFTATQRFNHVNMTGLMWNGTEGSNSLVAEVSFAPATILPNDQIVANWSEISFSEK